MAVIIPRNRFGSKSDEETRRLFKTKHARGSAVQGKGCAARMTATRLPRMTELLAQFVIGLMRQISGRDGQECASLAANNQRFIK